LECDRSCRTPHRSSGDVLSMVILVMVIFVMIEARA
jgi:hypothetical protein